MVAYDIGAKLDLLSRHQSFRRFAPRPTVGEVIDAPTDQPYRIRVRVYGHDYDEGSGGLHWLLRVSDTIWLEHIGVQGYLPHVHEVVDTLTDDEFSRRRVVLDGGTPAGPGPAADIPRL